eukprot:4647548-Pyramimonas_sp.AAC.1
MPWTSQGPAFVAVHRLLGQIALARPRRASQSVSRRINLCSEHRLDSVRTHAEPAAGATVTAGEENLHLTFDFTAVCGSKTEQIIDGRINFDQPNGHTHSHCDDKSLNITLTQGGVKEVAAQYVMEYNSFRPEANDP